MFEIIQLSIFIVALLYFTGFGVTLLFLPKHLRKDIVWFIPWTGVALIAIYGALLSFAKVPMSLGATIILAVSIVSAIYALLLNRLEKIPLWETLLLFAGFIICYSVNSYPLFKIGYPTVISLGNSDPVTYTNVADFFINHSVWEGKKILPYSPQMWAIGDIVHYSYRWGSAMLLSFFSVILRVRSYEVYSILMNLFFALSLPILFIFAKQLSKRFLLITGIFIFLTFSFNSTLSYMLYHVFFAQFAFTGLYIYILILFFTYKPQDSLFGISSTEVLLAFLISGVSTIYPEGIIYVVVPFALGTLFSYIASRDKRMLTFFIKVIALTVIINPVTAYTSIMQNMTIIFKTSRNTFIGWENIRHATPVEMLGFYNLYYYRPLPFIVKLIGAFIFGAIWYISFIVSRYKLWILAFTLFFVAVPLHFLIISPNFYLFHRNITYSLFFFSALFSIGVATILSRFTRLYVGIALLIAVFLTFRSFHRSFSQFYYHHLVVDQSLISLQELAKNKTVPTPFYTADVYLGEYNFWRHLWQDYMLIDTKIISGTNYPTEVYEKRLPNSKYVLAEKNMLSREGRTIKFSRTLWENKYYILGELSTPTDAKNKLLQ